MDKVRGPVNALTPNIVRTILTLHLTSHDHTDKRESTSLLNLPTQSYRGRAVTIRR